MSNITENTGQNCPHCGKLVDPLRAPAVSILGGHITHFCSAKCRESHLMRDPTPAPAGKEVELPTPDDSSSNSTAASQVSNKEDNEISREEKTLIAKKQSISPLIKYQLLHMAALAGLFLAAVLVPPLLRGMLPVVVVGSGTLVVAALGAFRERAFGLVRIAETIAIPVAAASVLVCSKLEIDPRMASIAAASLLLAKSMGRLLELLGRRRSGVLANIESSSSLPISSSWRDNSVMAAWIRRISLALEWIRYPAASLIGLAVFIVYSGSATEALLSGATALMALSPRALRMATGDAHLAAALAASGRQVIVRDAHVLDRIARSRIVLFLAKHSLVDENISVVDWKPNDGVNEKQILATLGTIEAKTKGRHASAIRQFVQKRGITPAPFEPSQLRPSLGVVGETPSSRAVCGSRCLLLNEGISTALLEPHAKTVEMSGRRALFLAVDDQLVSVFGAEETPVSNAHETNQKLGRLGLEPMMLTSAEVDAAQALGKRIGIENVRFETSEDEVGEVLEQITTAGDSVILVGHGPAFEENLRAAAASVAIGGSESTQAGVNARNQDILIVPWIVDIAQRARRSSEINLVASIVATMIGLALSAGWFSPLIVTFTASTGCAAAALSTLNGPYPLLERIAYRSKSLTKKVRKLAARRWTARS